MTGRRKLGRRGQQDLGQRRRSFQAAEGRLAWPLLLGVLVFAVLAGVCASTALWLGRGGLQEVPRSPIASEGPTSAEADPLSEDAAPPPQPDFAPPEPKPPPPEPEPVPPEPASRTPEITDPAWEPAGTPEETIKALKREAVELAGRLSRDFPDRVESLIIVGNVYGRHGHSAEALKCWEKCLELEPDRADVYYQMGEVALVKGEFDKTLALWRKAQKINPEMPGIHYALGRALMHLGRPEEAIQELEKEVQIASGSSMCHYLLGQAYFQVKEYEKSKHSYERAAELQPDLWNAYYGLTTVCARLGETDKAKQYREKFQKLKAQELKVSINRSLAHDDLAVVRRDLAQTYTEAGLLYRQEGHPRTAEQHWLRAAALDPKNTGCREHLALLYLGDRREHQALETYELLRKIDPQSPVYCVNVGIVNARLGRFHAAERAFLESQRLAPEQSLGYRALAQLYLRADKDLAEAGKLAQKAVGLEPIAANYFVLSEALDKNGDRQKALSALRRAVELAPHNARYRRVYEQFQQRR